MVNEQEKAQKKRPKTSKKKKSKESARADAKQSLDNEIAVSTKARKKDRPSSMSSDIDVEKGDQNGRDANRHAHNDNSQRRRKRERKQRRDEDHSEASHFESDIGSVTVPARRYSGGTRNYRQPYDNRYDQYDYGDHMSEMGNHDPIDEYGQDYDSEDEEKEPRFKYSTADLADGNFRNQKCCLIAVGIFFILIAVSVSVVLARLPKDKGEENGP